MLIQGTLIKGYGGFYYVYANDRVWECSLRGRFRIQNQDFIAGDKVLILPETEEKATIEKVLERRNLLVRPSIANVDQVIMVFAFASPEPDYNLLDRLLIQAENVGIDILIVFTKLDLIDPKNERLISYYHEMGYTVIEVSNKSKQGIEELTPFFKDRVSVLAGPSGAGKSSLINSLDPKKKLKTGEVSLRIGRGRHTTRHVELIPIAGGLVADTPGFSSLFLTDMKREELQNHFPDFTEHRNCRFKSCLHDQEPNCMVKEAVQNGDILGFRYEHYLQFLKEVIEAERKY